MKRKLAMLGVVLPLILIADIITKRWAVNVLQEEVSRPDFLGGYVPLTFALNRGAAFGISIGNDPRWFFIPVAFLALGLMVVLMVRARGDDYTRTVSLTLVIAGALGNLIDRIRWDRGVGDFIGPSQERGGEGRGCAGDRREPLNLFPGRQLEDEVLDPTAQHPDDAQPSPSRVDRIPDPAHAVERTEDIPADGVEFLAELDTQPVLHVL